MRVYIVTFGRAKPFACIVHADGEDDAYDQAYALYYDAVIPRVTLEVGREL